MNQLNMKKVTCQIVKLKMKQTDQVLFYINQMSFSDIGLLFDRLRRIYETYNNFGAQKCVICVIKKHDGQALLYTTE